MDPKTPSEIAAEQEKQARNERRKAFVEAAKAGDIPTLMRMLDEGAELESTWGAYAALGFAIYSRQPEAARALLERGADPNALSRDQHADTPLTVAGWVGCTEIIDDLIRHGANPFHKCNKGWTPRERAERNSRRETAAALKKAEADYLSWRVKRIHHIVTRRRSGPSGP